MNSIVVILKSILSSGLLATAISASLADERERRILRRQKIEEIYLSTTEWLG